MTISKCIVRYSSTGHAYSVACVCVYLIMSVS